MHSAAADARGPVLQTRGVVPRRSHHSADEGITISLFRQELVCVLGDNGAGKSALLAALGGFGPIAGGSILVNGVEVQLTGPRAALDLGIALVPQDSRLVETMSVTENVVLGAEPGPGLTLDYRAARRRVRDICTHYGFTLDPDARVESLRAGLRQRVALVQAIFRGARILLLDEPNALLAPQESEGWFALLRALCADEISILFTSNRPDIAAANADRIYVLRDGRVVGEHSPNDPDPTALTELLNGPNPIRPATRVLHEPHPEAVFSVERLRVRDDLRRVAINGINFEVRPGEVVGIAGATESGQRELAEAIIGLRPVDAGGLYHLTEDISRLSVRQRIHRGVGMVPSDRARQGLVLPLTIGENMILGFHDRGPHAGLLGLRYREINKHAAELAAQYGIRSGKPTDLATVLTGGDQQKLILARELTRKPSFLLICHPTQGLDAAERSFVHAEIFRLRMADVGILLISTDLGEIAAVADRVLVLTAGQITAEHAAADLNTAELSRLLHSEAPETATVAAHG